jgi:hypothetical protein
MSCGKAGAGWNATGQIVVLMVLSCEHHLYNFWALSNRAIKLQIQVFLFKYETKQFIYNCMPCTALWDAISDTKLAQQINPYCCYIID